MRLPVRPCPSCFPLPLPPLPRLRDPPLPPEGEALHAGDSLWGQGPACAGGRGRRSILTQPRRDPSVGWLSALTSPEKDVFEVEVLGVKAKVCQSPYKDSTVLSPTLAPLPTHKRASPLPCEVSIVSWVAPSPSPPRLATPKGLGCRNVLYTLNPHTCSPCPRSSPGQCPKAQTPNSSRSPCRRSSPGL